MCMLMDCVVFVCVGFTINYYNLMFGIYIAITSLVSMAIQEYHMRYIDRVHYAKNELAKDRQIIRRYITTLEGQKSSDQSFDCPSEDQDIPLPEVESKSNEPLLITF